MGTLGPTGTTADVTTFTNFASWSGTGTFGINSALTNFGWTRTADLNQINWSASPSAPPLSGSTFPISLQPGATFNGGTTVGSYAVNCRGTWISGTTYNLYDVVTSPTTGASYILAREFFVSSVSVSGPFATCTAANNLNTGGGDKVRFTVVSTHFFLLNQTFTVVSATSTTFVINISEIIGSANNISVAESAYAGIQVS